MVEPTGHCPYLGLKQNQAIRFASPTAEHRCYAAGQAQEIPTFEPNYQTTYCLSPNHTKCPLYTGLGLPPTEKSAGSAILVTKEPPSGLRGWFAGLAPRDRAIYGAIVALLGLILLFYAAAGFNLLRDGSLITGGPTAPTAAPTSDGGQLPAGPSPSPEPPAATATATVEPSATARPTERPSARPTRTARPTSAPAATATDTPAPSPTNTASPTSTPTRVFVPPPPPPPTNTPSDLIPLPTDTPEPTLEPSMTSEPPTPTFEGQPEPTGAVPTAEPPTAEPPTAEPPTPELGTPAPTPEPARTGIAP